MQPLARPTSRRRFLAGLGGIGAAVALGTGHADAILMAPGGAVSVPPRRRPDPQQAIVMEEPAPPPPKIGKHLAWVWRFSEDGEPTPIRDTLAAHGLGMIFKTHDGTTWMPDVGGRSEGSPERVEGVARYFEEGGVPFHAWCVVRGHDPIAEARMAASVLASGARTLTLDLEAGEHFWIGSTRDAEVFGEELRKWQPDAFVAVSTDGRPWEIDHTPIDQFAAFTDAMAPQTYWNFFKGPINTSRYREHYRDPGPAGVTPSLVVDAAVDRLGGYGLPVYPIGDATTNNEHQWSEFIGHSFERQAPALSVWRYGLTDPLVWRLLQQSPPVFA